MKDFSPVSIIPIIGATIILYYILYLFFKKILTLKIFNSVTIKERTNYEISKNKIQSGNKIEEEINFENKEDKDLPEDDIKEIKDPELFKIFENINKIKQSLSETVLEDGKFKFKDANEEKLKIVKADQERRRLSLERIKNSSYGK